MREICFDTETTGIYPENGDRLVEIGAVELINHLPTGKIFHKYINPQRDVPEEVVKIHGLTNEFLADKPVFADIAQEWIDFIGEDGIFVAHNAEFDMRFINFELKKLGYETYEWDRVVDTLAIARNQFPGARNNLDALCKRFNIDNSARTFHGALLDAQLLSEVYLQLLGIDEPSINFMSEEKNNQTNENVVFDKSRILKSRNFSLSAEELEQHKNFIDTKIKDAIWNK
ncbi:MAG: DNA polymerase III subunit epsilon [Alphaproteobacteria bacterium]|nr:DNA polymerase III subunit epsilon [Alphaproteobacteria bacterium]